MAESIGIKLPDQEPVLHYSRRLALYIWPTELLRPSIDALTGDRGGYSVWIGQPEFASSASSTSIFPGRLPSSTHL